MGRLSNWVFGLQLLPSVATNAAQRQLLAEMRSFIRGLPTLVKQPMPVYMAQLGDGAVGGFSAETIRKLADLAALLERQSPLGICLRRSLVRYHYLNERVPLAVQFGARFDKGSNNASKKRAIAGHAWVTHNNQPYFEEDENWQNFTVVYQWPSAS